MGFAQIWSRAQVGLAAPLVRVEVHLGSGLPTFAIVGLPAPVVRESRERVRAALAHCGYEIPAGRITVNLAPADLPKEGGRFDLAVALGLLVASGQLRAPQDLERCEFYGELGLAGELKPVPGLLLAALQAAGSGHSIYAPAGNAADLRRAGCALPHVAADLDGICAQLRGEDPPPQSPLEGAVPVASGPAAPGILEDVRGQWQAKRALVVAATGSHSLLFVGSPGTGKSMLAQRLPGLLPALSAAEALEVAAIDAVARRGETPRHWGQRPFRAPHHTASAHAIVGGGKDARPGEVSLAHLGILFLDELPEFDRRVLEALREPLETGVVSISRANLRADYPAAFQFVAAMNPCPCGYLGDASGRCRCNQPQIRRYRARLSGPLLDRIDLHVSLPRPEAAVLAGAVREDSAAARDGDAFSSRVAAERVVCARDRQMARQNKLNARLTAAETMPCCRPNAAALALLGRAADKLQLSARSYHRLLRVARSIADLEDVDELGAAQVAEALSLRVPVDSG